MQGSSVNLVLLGLLITFFGVQQRNRPQLYFRFWFAGWILIFLSFVTYELNFSNPLASTINELFRLDTLFLGGAAFVLSFVVKGGKLLRPMLLSAAVTVTGCLAIDLSVVGHLPFWLLCIFIVIGQGASIVANLALPVRWRRVRIVGVWLCIAFFVATVYIAKDSETIYNWILCEIFLYAGLLYAGTYKRLSIEWVAGTTGFMAWSAFYILYNHLQAHPRAFAVLWEFWNLPKYLVSFAMILRILEGSRREMAGLADGYKLLYDDFRVLYENHPLPMWIYDRESLRFLSVNTAACAGYGYTKEQFLEKSVTEIVFEVASAKPNQALSGPTGGHLQHGRHLLSDGRVISVELTEHEILFGNRAAGFVLAVDITEREELNRELVYRAQHDALTGLPNRLLLEDRLSQCLERAVRDHLYVALFTIDVDRFKLINDTYGHVVGDDCLKEIAKRLSSRVRTVDTIARTGGEEFTILAGGIVHRSDVEKMAEELLRLFDSPLRLPGQELKVSISVGASLYPDNAGDAVTLRKNSDQALFYAKRMGRNRFALASTEICASFNEALAVERAVRDALRNDGFEMHYQPIYDKRGYAARFEALLRMKASCPRHFSPATFIPIAEESGLILSIGSWVIRAVCAQMVAWRDLTGKGVRIAINVSARQLAEKDFAASFLATLREHDLSPSWIELELTETALLTEPVLIKECMATLASSGIEFAIDDFGTGYSSLARLADLPIAMLKIDRSFVAQLNRTGRGDGIVTAIIQMADTMGVGVVAEGVEDTMQLNQLLGRGCDYFQGYYLSKPIPAEMLTHSFEERSPLLLRHPNFDAGQQTELALYNAV